MAQTRRRTHTRTWFLIALAVAAAASRLAPHPPNFSPLAAVALFGAALLPTRALGLGVPLATLLVSDLLLELAHRAGWLAYGGFYPGQWVVYACALATALLGLTLRRGRTAGSVAAATLASSVVFFLATNFVYFYGNGSLYPRTPAGLLLCYEAALPFFGNGLAGDAFFAATLFGGLALAESRFPALRARRAETPAPAAA